jgi:imidazoleglycerol-phosphate dehydratase
MEHKRVSVERNTKETQISAALHLGAVDPVDISVPVPFFAHMLNAMAFHGGFSLTLKAQGDIEVDPHHLLEDTGLVLGQAFRESYENVKAVNRYGSSLIPMDDALAECVIDVCSRPYLQYTPVFPQTMIGTLDPALFQEFFYAFSHTAKINLHILMRSGSNSHHIIEAVFKSFGRALKAAYAPNIEKISKMSTKGLL